MSNNKKFINCTADAKAWARANPDRLVREELSNNGKVFYYRASESDFDWIGRFSVQTSFTEWTPITEIELVSDSESLNHSILPELRTTIQIPSAEESLKKTLDISHNTKEIDELIEEMIELISEGTLNGKTSLVIMGNKFYPISKHFKKAGYKVKLGSDYNRLSYMKDPNPMLVISWDCYREAPEQL